MISIIIPVYNEGKTIGSLVRYLKSKRVSDQECEIIVVDGKSEDDTVQTAKKAGAHVINSPKKGRARQMNYGAEKAKGEILYFLHADTFPPQTFIDDIQKTFEKGFLAGCFRLQFDEARWLLRFYGWCTRFDIPAFRFGDQSLFISKSLFEEIGRFRENLIVMEDNEIIYRIRKKSKFKIIPKSVTTSARKYEKNGYVRLQFIFTLIYCLYHLGVPQQGLVKIYKEYIYR
ncbi:MAG TPA: TIGR04283 family arsenosugar biosynthesis glycosyltransferase [Balneolales bacterium]|nr:TIGR04283 family arsenosugar biosynthesis glycosyltransferase [Balneolales bacterium]